MHLSSTFNFNTFIDEYTRVSEFLKHILGVFIEIYTLMLIWIYWVYKANVFFDIVFIDNFYQFELSKFFLLLMQECLLLLSAR